MTENKYIPKDLQILNLNNKRESIIKIRKMLWLIKKELDNTLTEDEFNKCYAYFYNDERILEALEDE